MERPALSIGTVSGKGDQLDTVGPLAKPGHGGDGEGINAGKQGESACAERKTGEVAGEEDNEAQWCGKAGGAAQDHPEAEDPGDPLMTVETHGEKGQDDKKAEEGRAEPGGPAAGRDHHEGTLRTDDGYPGSSAAGGVSRKTYYKWEQRGLAALLEGVQDQKGGRPETPPEHIQKAAVDKEFQELKQKNERLEQQVKLKDIVYQMRLEAEQEGDKKK